jgi:hypothetical protein
MAKQLIPKGGNDIVMTPLNICELIVKHFNPQGKILEPCCGTGNFLKFLPKETDWCEISKGKDFFNYNKKVDWIITNPPWSKIRPFMQHSMKIADNIVFLATINHLWLKARLRDIKEANFGIKEILLLDTPKEFPQSGFQMGCFHLQKNYKGNIKLTD